MHRVQWVLLLLVLAGALGAGMLVARDAAERVGAWAPTRLAPADDAGDEHAR